MFMGLQPSGDPDAGLSVSANGTLLEAAKSLFSFEIFFPHLRQNTFWAAPYTTNHSGDPNSSDSTAQFDANQVTAPLFHSKPLPW